MPSKEVSSSFPVPKDFVLELLNRLVAENGWKLQAKGVGHYNVKLPMMTLNFAVSSSTVCEVWIEQEGEDYTCIRIRASNWRPWMMGGASNLINYIRSALGESIERSLAMAANASQLRGDRDPASSPERLSELLQKGLITRAEFEAKRSEILQRM